MSPSAFILAAAILGLMLFPTLGHGQAAAEYGLAASKSTAITSRASSSMGSRTRSIYGGVSRRTTLRVPPPPSKNLQAVMQENREKLAAKSQNGGTVHVESVPTKAAIAVDGELVDYAPADLKLPEGTHLIELTNPGFVPWRMEVSVNRQESTSVTAHLENRYRSSITISFQE
jgi:hypothetical protein